MTSWPLATVRITDKYGPRVHPITGEVGRQHNAVDFGAAWGTPLLAIARMRLVSKGSNLSSSGAGHWANWELVDEPFVRFAYWHQAEAIPYDIGTVKNEGERVGTVGSTGASTGPHLHLEMYHGGILRDPLPWLQAAISITPNTPKGFPLALSDQQQEQLYDAIMAGGAYSMLQAIVDVLRTELAPQLAAILAGASRFPGQPYTAAEAIVNAVRGEKPPAAVVDEAALARQLAPLIGAQLGTLSDATVADLAKRVADEHSKRLAA